MSAYVEQTIKQRKAAQKPKRAGRSFETHHTLAASDRSMTLHSVAPRDPSRYHGIVMRAILASILSFGFFAATAAAQNFDKSANGNLKGAYFVRQVMLSNISSTGSIGRARSIVGSVTFDGNGNYSFTGQLMDTQGNQPQSYTASGGYVLAPNGLFQIQNIIDKNDTDYGAVGAAGPSAFVASSTEDDNWDILVGIPAGANVTNGSLQGTYQAGFLDFLQGSSANVRQASFPLNSNGQGSFGNVAVTGSAANLGNNTMTQTASSVSFSLTANGSGTISFPAASSPQNQLVSGTKNFYVSSDGTLLLGGSPNGFDLLLGVKGFSGSATNSSYQGLYYEAALEFGGGVVDAFYGSTNANGAGKAISHLRLNPSNDTVYDFTFDTDYNVSSDATIQKSSFQYIIGLNSQAVIVTGKADNYSLTLELKAPAFSGTGVFLNPVGVVNSANFAPVTNPVAPNEFVTLFGSGLASSTLQAQSLPLPTTLGGVQVIVNGRPASLFYVSPTQISAVVPFATGGTSSNPENYATFQVTNNGVASNTATLYLSTTAPGIFSLTQNGVGPAAVLHSDFSVVSASSPAKRGETIQIFLAGLGAVTPSLSDGAAAPSNPLSLVNGDVAVAFENADGSFPMAQVTFKGLAPGFAGLYQVNAVIPNNVDSGDVYLDLSTPDAVASQVKIAIAP